jgi:hypothetical protein
VIASFGKLTSARRQYAGPPGLAIALYGGHNERDALYDIRIHSVCLHKSAVIECSYLFAAQHAAFGSIEHPKGAASQ